MKDRKWLRRAVWVAYIPAVSILLYVPLLLLVALANVLTIGQVNGDELQYRFSMMLMWPVLIPSFIIWAGSGVAWMYKKLTLYAILDEISSIGLAVFCGLVASIIHTRYAWWGPWLAIGAGFLLWLFFVERHGANPWSRMVRMAFFSGWVFYILHHVSHM